MALVLLNIEDIPIGGPGYDAQSVPDKTDFIAMQNLSTGSGWEALGGVTAAGSGLSVVVPAGNVPIVSGQIFSPQPQSSVLLATANTYDRKDIIMWSPSSISGVTQVNGYYAYTGGPNSVSSANWTRLLSSSPPIKICPTELVSDSALLVAEVYVPANATSITQDNIVDKTPYLGPPVASAMISGVWPNLNINAAQAATARTALGLDTAATLAQTAFWPFKFSAVGDLPIGTGPGAGSNLTIGPVGSTLTVNSSGTLQYVGGGAVSGLPTGLTALQVSVGAGGWSKWVLKFSSYTNASPATVTFPTSTFTDTPGYMVSPQLSTVVPTSVSSTSIIIPAVTPTAVTGFIVIEGV